MKEIGILLPLRQLVSILANVRININQKHLSSSHMISLPVPIYIDFLIKGEVEKLKSVSPERYSARYSRCVTILKDRTAPTHKFHFSL